MKTIKLHTALKLKNRLVGEVARLQSVLARENSRRDDNPSKVDAGKVDSLLRTTRHKLVRLKTAIAAANIPIYAALARMEETKSALAFYQTLNTREGVETVATYKDNVTYNHTAYLNREAVDELVASFQEEINAAQDEVDSFNASTTITVDLD